MTYACQPVLQRPRDAVLRYGYQKSLILHSDHGSQYASRKYRAAIAKFGSIQQSMGRTHCCFDNARMESFFATLKKKGHLPA